MRVGMFALMTPVMTFTDGRCVAMTRCMPAARAQLRQAADAVLHLAGGDHHQIGQLVDDDDDLRHGLFAIGSRRLVVALDIAHAAPGKLLVAIESSPPRPIAGRWRAFLRVGHHRRKQVRDAVVDGQLHHLGVDQNEAHLVRRGPVEDRDDDRIDAHRSCLNRSAPAISTCGILAISATI